MIIDRLKYIGLGIVILVAVESIHATAFAEPRREPSILIESHNSLTKLSALEHQVVALENTNQQLQIRLNQMSEQQQLWRHEALVQQEKSRELTRQLNEYQSKFLSQTLLSTVSFNQEISRWSLAPFVRSPVLANQPSWLLFIHSVWEGKEKLFLLWSLGVLMIFIGIWLWALKVYKHQTVAKVSRPDAVILNPLVLDPQKKEMLSTQLDLARAYIDMGELQRVPALLREVMQLGDNKQKTEAYLLQKEMASHPLIKKDKN
jgi:FimV-like protein